VFFKRHFFAQQIFLKRVHVPDGYSLTHLLVKTLKTMSAPTSICIQKREVPRGVVATPPLSQPLDKIGIQFERLALYFRGQAIQRDQRECCTMKTEVGNPIWQPVNRKYTYFSL